MTLFWDQLVSIEILVIQMADISITRISGEKLFTAQGYVLLHPVGKSAGVSHAAS